MHTSQPNSEIHLQAAALLSEWEQTRPSGSKPVTSEFQLAYAQFVEEALTGSQETNLELADLREVVQAAGRLVIGRAEASGPGRALRALAEAYQNPQSSGAPSAPQGKALLALQSRPEAELQMDELTDILETLQAQLGSEWELIFGYGAVPNLAAELRIMFVLAPRA